MKEQMVEQGLPAGSADQLASQLTKQLSLPGFLTSCWRKVDASPDSTFILVTKNDENDGNIKMDIRDTRLFFTKGDIYLYDPGKRKFLTDTLLPIPGIFEKKQESKIMLGHRCIVYISSDSSCRVWVAEDLPAYINPGVRVGDIKGAIMAYDLKQTGRTIHAEMAKIE
jgi:hypothetical protein